MATAPSRTAPAATGVETGRGGPQERRRRESRIGQRRPASPATALLGVHAQHHPLHAVGAVGGEQLDSVLAALAGQERGERAAKGELAQPPRAGLVEDRELGVESGGEGVDAQQPCAEAVEGADRGALGVTRGLALAQLQQARAHPLTQLRGGALGEGDRQDPRRGDAVLAHSAHEALDQHRGLAAAGPRGEQQRTATARDGLLLLGG